ncbi:MAG: anaerobic selenocysteine-containing dehydrogenase [Gammaproteobacteria bacterium]|jgi:anaerobic selenocysteine-containing dehydrogenase
MTKSASLDAQTAPTSSKKIAAFCTQCRSRCGCIAETEQGRLVRITPFPEHPSGAQLCPKGRAAPELVYHADRILTPMRRSTPKGSADPQWQAISWDEALDTIAEKMRDIAHNGGPEQTAFSVTTPSGTHISDAITWIERLIRAYGSPNTVYGTEICNWHKDFASRFTYGHDIGTPDFAHTDCVVLWGNNPTTTWLARAGEINKARRRGAKLIVIDPRPTSFAKRADVWLQIRPGTDQALALSLAHLLIGEYGFDESFVRQWSNAALLVREDNGRFLRESDVQAGGSSKVLFAVGDDEQMLSFDAANGHWHESNAQPKLRVDTLVSTSEAALRCRSAFSHYQAAVDEYPPERAAALTGIDVGTIRKAAALLAASARIAYYAWNGISQSTIASQTDRAVSLLYTLTGCYGAKGGNVPGNAAEFTDISGQELLSAGQRAKALGIDQRPLGPPRQGWITARDMYRAVIDHRPYPVRMLMSFGTNLLVSQPDADLAQQAFKALELHVHADFFINASARYADILLPAATSWEREGLRAGFDCSLEGLRRVQLRPAIIAARGQARSDIDIVLGLAKRLGLADQFFNLDVDRGHDIMLSGTGISTAMLRQQPQGIDVDGHALFRAHETLDANGIADGFPTPTRRIEIYSEVLHEHGIAPVPRLNATDLPSCGRGFPLRLGSAKTLAFCHSQHRNLPSLRRLEPDPPLEISIEDATARGIEDGDWVAVVTSVGTVSARARLVKGLAQGAVFAQHGWWVDGEPGTPYDAQHRLAANLNQVIDTTVADPISGSIALRASHCEVHRIEPPSA